MSVATPEDTNLSPHSPAPRAADPVVGAMVGPYKLEALLGVGSTGLVFEGVHQTLGRRVAIKCLHADQTNDAMLVARFLQEARLVNQINHPHIIEVHDFVEAPGQVYAVMELLRGETLASRMATRGLTLAQIFDVSRQLALALDAAHSLGVVHRDLKPENIFLCSDQLQVDWVKVLDFGVAKLMNPQLGRVFETQLGTVVGTPRYMSPEQVTGRTVDSRTDIYAFGVVLYELLSGSPPFDSLSFGQLASDILNTPPAPLPATTMKGEPVPLLLSQLTFACLEKDRASRPASMSEVARLLAGLPARLAAPILLVRRRRTHVGLATVALVVLGTALRSEPPPVAAALVHTPLPIAEVLAPLPVPVPDVTTVMLVTTPPGAMVTNAVTGAILGRTPLEVSLPKRDDTLELQLALDNYVPQRRVVHLDENQRLELVLTPVPRVTVKKRRMLTEGVLDAY